MRIDLHTHSNCSDGTDTPAELICAAREAGLDVVGLVDHDTVTGWGEATAAVKGSGLSLVRGMEVTAKAGDVSVHILAYLFDPENDWVVGHMEALQKSRAGRAREMVERLATDFDVTWEDVLEASASSTTIGRPHIADALVARGIVADRTEAFDRLIHPGTPYYVKQYAPQAVDVVRGIAGAGGKTVWAHPWAAKRGRVAPIETFGELAAAGLFGVEVDHRDNPVQTRGDLADIVEELGLARFGSSDYHGTGKPNSLGEYTTSPEVFECLIQGTYAEVVS